MINGRLNMDDKNICARCGTQNVNDAIFCKNCGHRLDGNALCPNCSRLTPSDGEFCIYCGSNRNSTVIKKDAAFKQVIIAKNDNGECVYNDKQTNISSDEIPSVICQKKDKTSKIKKENVFSIVSLMSCCLVILFSTIFSFLIGITITISEMGTEFLSSSTNIYYYFSDAFIDIETANDSSYGLVGPIFGLSGVLILFLGIVFALVYAILGIVNYFNKKTTNIVKYAMISYFIYLSGIIVFMLNIFATIDTASASISTNLDGVTLAGIILGAILLVVGIVFKSINDGIRTTLNKYLAHSLSSFGITILGIVAISLFTIGTFSATTDLVVGVTNVTASVGIGISGFSAQMLNIHELFFTSYNQLIWDDFIRYYISGVIILFAIFAFVISALVSFIIMIQRIFSNFGYSYSKKVFVCGIMLGSSTFLIGVLQIILALVVGPYFFNNISGNISIPIVLIVIGFLIIIGAIICKFLVDKFEKKNLNLTSN